MKTKGTTSQIGPLRLLPHCTMKPAGKQNREALFVAVGLSSGGDEISEHVRRMQPEKAQPQPKEQG